MAENDQDQDKSQKTEQPTAHRLEEAFKKGQVALSKEINHWFILGAVMLLLMTVMPYFLRRLTNNLQIFIAASDAFIDGQSSFFALGKEILLDVGITMGIPLGVMVIAAIASGFVQTRFAISASAIMPKAERISPFKGIKRIISRRAIVEFIKGLTKICVIAFSIYFVLRHRLDGMRDWIHMPVVAILTTTKQYVVYILTTVLCVLSAIAISDYLYQKFEFIKTLMMSKDEIRKEYKEMEGDPHIKHRQRQLREEMVRKNMMAAVPNATVMLTNPTHFSIAIQYDQDTMDAPIVIAKGQDYLALRMRERAKECKIPIVENPPLTRALYQTVDLNQEILPEHYQAVAEVIRLVYKMKRQYF